MAISRAQRFRRKQASLTNAPVQGDQKTEGNSLNKEELKPSEAVVTEPEIKKEAPEVKPDEHKVEAESPKEEPVAKESTSEENPSDHAKDEVKTETPKTHESETELETGAKNEEAVSKLTSEKAKKEDEQSPIESEKPKKRRRGRPKGSKNKSTIEAEKKAEKKASKEAAKSESSAKRSRSPSTKATKVEASESKSSSDDGEPSRAESAHKPVGRRRTRRNFAALVAKQNSEPHVDDDFFSQQEDVPHVIDENTTHSSDVEDRPVDEHERAPSIEQNENTNKGEKESSQEVRKPAPVRSIRRRSRNRFQNLAIKEQIKQEKENEVINQEPLDSDIYPEDRQPVSGRLSRITGYDMSIVIRPFSTVPFVDGKIPEKAHQETSNIRFTDHDRVAAEESGLSWD